MSCLERSPAVLTWVWEESMCLILSRIALRHLVCERSPAVEWWHALRLSDVVSGPPLYDAYSIRLAARRKYSMMLFPVVSWCGNIALLCTFDLFHVASGPPLFEEFRYVVPTFHEHIGVHRRKRASHKHIYTAGDRSHSYSAHTNTSIHR